MHRRSSLKRVAAVLAGLALAGSALSACDNSAPQPSNADKTTLRLGIGYELGGWDPARMVNGADREYQWRPVFDTLLQCDQEGGIFPGAAEKFEFSKDSTTLQLKIREGMTFDDGSPINAEAVKASLEYMSSAKATQANLLKGVSASVEGDMEVVLTSQKPNANLANLMCGVQGIVLNPAAIASPNVGDAPVSSGPYSFDAAKSTSGSSYTFTKRDDYWDSESYPYKSLTLTVLADPATRISALSTRQVDGVALTASTVKEAENTGITVLRNTNLAWGLFLLDRAGEKVPALGDERVRRAINMVFDRPAITKAIWGDEGTPTTQIFAPSTGGFNEALSDAYEFDVEGAKRLMAEAGYAGGFEIQFPLVTNITDQAAPVIVQQLALLNIKVTEVPLSGPSALADLLAGKFPMLFYSMLARPEPDVMNNYVMPDATWNPYHSTTPELEKLAAEVQTLHGSDADPAYEAINEILVKDAWYAPWAFTPSFFGMTNPELVTKRTDRYGFLPHLRDFK